MKKTKIVATIGPASSNKETLKKMIEAGMNVARLNFSHGTHESHGELVALIRELSVETKRPVGILADLQGPRIRVGNAEPFEMKKGDVIFVSDKKPASTRPPRLGEAGEDVSSTRLDSARLARGGTTDEKELVIDSDRVSSALQIGERILIEDGMMALEVIEREGETVKAKVINGGTVKPRKGINIPDTKLHFGAVTEKDQRDLEFAISQGVDFIGLSFVSNGKEVEETRLRIKELSGEEDSVAQIVVKIERKDAITNLAEIVEATDIVMVARGDLGIELDESRVVIYQKEIIAMCLEKVKPVIVATQMLDSMIHNPIPTRAEVADVTNAVIDHTDAVMLSGESANGEYPVKAIRMMENIIQNTEDSPFDDVNSGFLDDDILSDYASVIDGAHDLAISTGAKAIMMFSESGYTARIMSHHRPNQLMVVATTNPKTYQQLSIVWGIRTYLCDNNKEREEFIDFIIEKTKEDKKIVAGDKVVVILGKTKNGKSVTLLGIQEV